MKCLSLPSELTVGFHAANTLLPNTDHITVSFEPATCLSLHMEDGTVVIGYSSKAEALRGMSMAARFAQAPNPFRQTAKFDTLTVMVDCSRNAVLNFDSVKELMVTVAMFGFNAMMLYTEDTYEIPGQPYFGHMRGRYTVEELQALAAYGEQIGIELIPCIQTLAHLNGIFYWPKYQSIKDIDDILLAEDPRTYELIEEMLKTCVQCFRTKRIHVGLDEAHNLGRGAYTNRNGYDTKTNIMLRHLEKVVALCEKYGLEPIMWSDMFFRMQFNGQYYVDEGELSASVIEKIPQQVALCYWNYYHNPNFEPLLDHMFSQHAKTNCKLWFAGGCWCWNGPAPKNYFSNSVTPVHLHYAEKYGVKNIIATAWGDDGAECTVWNTLPSLLQYAELNYGDASEETLDARCMDCLGMHYDQLLLLDRVGMPEEIELERLIPPCPEKLSLYNDPMLGLMDDALQRLPLAEKFRKDKEALTAVPKNRFSFLFDAQRTLAALLEAKTDLSTKIRSAYRNGDKATLAQIATQDIPQVLALLDQYSMAYYTLWHRVNKTFGYEIHDIRFGGMRQRLLTAQLRLQQHLDGTLPTIEELEQPNLPINPKKNIDNLNSWRKISSVGMLNW